jgi:secreted PhoX family phosphatase
MPLFRSHVARRSTLLLAALLAGCSSEEQSTTPNGNPAFSEPGLALSRIEPGQSAPFTELASSAACIAGGGGQQVLAPQGFAPITIAAEGEPDFPNDPDMITVNETGREPGRYLFRTHELGSNGGVSVTDLFTGATHIVARRADWERFDGIAWTPWGTLLAGEETRPSALKDPEVPNAVGGHVYEIDPSSGGVRVLAAVGARAHEGIRLDRNGNLYGISEASPGFIYRFVPERYGDLTRGTLYALRIVEDLGDRTGWGEWVALDGDPARLDSDQEALDKGATAYARPEDVEIGTSSGDDRRGNHTLYVAITSENRVLAIHLAPEAPGRPGQVFVSDYVRPGVNATAEFSSPDNLALDQAGNLYITEDPGGSSANGKTQGDDVWFAPFNPASARQAQSILRFLSITDCDAEPTGVYVSPSGKTLFLDIQHRGGDGQDLTLGIQRLRNTSFAIDGER